VTSPVAAHDCRVTTGTATSGTIERVPPAVIVRLPLAVTAPTVAVPDTVRLAAIVAPEPVTVKVAPAATLTCPVADDPQIDGTVRVLGLQTFTVDGFPDAVGSAGQIGCVTLPDTQFPATLIGPPPVEVPAIFTLPVPVIARTAEGGTFVF